MASVVSFAKFVLRQHNGAGVDFDLASQCKVALITATWTPSQTGDEDASVSGIRANEVSGSNYTAGGASCANPFCTQDGAYIEIGWDDITWAQHASGFTDARYALIYEVSTDKAIAYIDLGGNKGNVNGPLTLDGDPATGWIRINSNG